MCARWNSAVAKLNEHEIAIIGGTAGDLIDSTHLNDVIVFNPKASDISEMYRLAIPKTDGTKFYSSGNRSA